MTEYQAERAENVFGYSEEGGFAGIGSEPDHTAREMPSDMRQWLDKNVLEGKVHVQVHDDPVLGNMAADIEQSFQDVQNARSGGQ